MTIREFLTYLRGIDVRIWLDGAQLRFSAPAGAMTPALRSELARRKEELISFLSQVDGLGHVASSSLTPAVRDGCLPLSYAQERLWFLNQMTPDSPFYNVPIALRLVGRLDTAALQRSLSAIMHRHEVLRTLFVVVDGQPRQIITASRPIDLPMLDLRRLSHGDREAQIAQLSEEEARCPFDLTHGPLLRATLLHAGDAEHVLLLTMHHIVSDEWSMGLFFRELSAFYAAFVADQPTPLPPLPIQYADYAIWQSRLLTDAALDQQLDYWRRCLDGAPTVLELPTDHPRPAVQRYHGAVYTFACSGELSDDLKALALRESATLFMLLLAAFSVLLHRYTQQEDIVIGTPTAGRNQAETEDLIGVFLNMLVLRTDLSGNPSFHELLGRVREACLKAYAHQEMPFEKLVEVLQPERALGRTPLVQVVFDLHSNSGEEVTFPGLTLQMMERSTGTAKFDMSLAMEVTERLLSGSVEYNTDLFELATIARMVGHYRKLLEGIVADPDQPIAELPLLTEDEYRELLFERNDTASDYPKTQCFHELFAAQAARTPDAVAVVFEARHLTYRELNRRASQLAHYLQQHAVRPEACVGICVERSLELVVAPLGIFQAGGAFMPLDPTFPKERMAFMLTDARVSVLLTQARLRDRLPECTALVVCLDTDWEALIQPLPVRFSSLVTAENLAYVIYTSGSTGRPKGVMIPHRGFVNYLAWCAVAYGAAKGRGAPVQSSIAADAIFPSLFAPLLVGTSVIVLPETQALEALRGALQTHSPFSLIKITPSQLEVLNQQLPHTDATGWIHTLVVGAEALRGEILSFWQAHAPGTILLNEYGPTETVVGCSIYEVPAGQAIAGPVPIGLPIANLQFYVLDRALQPVPIGVPGELYIGGDGLAWGYLNRPDLTAERFIATPFSSTPGARLYKTGDVVRYLPDRVGNIEFLGRTDDQVKIRGYRIEPTEIETALNQHHTVRESVVLARADVLGDKRLVAYVVPTQWQALSVGDLRSYLKEQLPAYMIPSAFVLLEAMPLAPHGKLDRKALPAPDIAGAERAATYEAPKTPVEEALAGIWSDLLGVEHVGINDNFFELGGYSLLAIRLVREIQQQLGQELPLSVLFQRATVKESAVFLSQATPSRLQSPIVAIQPHGSKRPFFCVSPGDGNALWYMRLAHHLGPDQPFYGIHDLAADRDELGAPPLDDLAAAHVEAIRAVQLEGPYLIGGWSSGGRVAFAIASLLRRQGHDVGLLAIMDSLVLHCSNKTADEYDADFLAQLVLDLAQGAVEKTHRELYDNLRQLKYRERWGYFLDQIGQGGASYHEDEIDHLRGARHDYVSKIQTALNYRMEVFPGQITLFRSDDRIDSQHPAFRYADVPSPDASIWRELTEHRGWGQWSTEPVKVYPIPGSTHDRMALEPHVRGLAQHLGACLAGLPYSQEQKY